MAETIAAAPPRPPLWRNERFRRVLGQVIFAILVVLVGRELSLNLEFNSAAKGQNLGFEFLSERAGFEIGDTPIEYSQNDAVSRGVLAGYLNTLRVSLLGIVLATILGLVIGVARLSPNWMLRKLAQVYVELIRNTPVPLQVVFWWGAVFLAIASIGDSLSVFDLAFLSNRGLVIPWLRLEEGASTWGLISLAGLIVAAVLWRWRTRHNERTGEPHHRVLYALGAIVAFGVAGYLLTGTPTTANVPRILPTSFGFKFDGGVRFTPEFAALLLALVIYTAAFIAEIIRGSIQAVPKGQREAAESLGLSRFEQLRFVILPQALRIAIPAINSQYLNLLKNSSLGVLISFFELNRVVRSISTQKGYVASAYLLALLLYLGTCLVISFLMNLLNRAITSKGVR
jgi:general L-amino acid transport system permease protein